MIRAVLDTNIVISGMLWSGSPKQVIEAVCSGDVLPLISEVMLDELRDVLARPKFLPRLQRIGKNASQLTAEYLKFATVVEPADIPEAVKTDPDDDAVLACAVGGKADFIVSGDKDLLVLKAYANIPILNAEQFLQHLSSE